MKKKLLAIIPFMAMLIACNSNPTPNNDDNKGNEGGDINNPDTPDKPDTPDTPNTDKYIPYDSSITPREGGTDVAEIDKSVTIQDALNGHLDAFKSMNALTVEDKFAIDLRNISLPKPTEKEDVEQTDGVIFNTREEDFPDFTSIEEVKTEQYTIQLSGEFSFTICEELINSSGEETYNYWASLYLKSLSLHLESEETFTEPIDISNLTMRFVVSYVSEEIGERIYIDLGNLSDYTKEILTIINPFVEEYDLTNGMIPSYIKSLLTNYRRCYVDVEEIDIEKIIDYVISSLGEEFDSETIEKVTGIFDKISALIKEIGGENTAKTDYIKCVFNLLKEGLDKIDHEKYEEICASISDILSEGEVKSYSGGEIGVFNKIDNDSINAFIDELESTYTALKDSIPEEYQDMIPEGVSSEIQDINFEELKLPEDWRIDARSAYYAGKQNGTTDMAIESLAFKANVQDGNGLYLTFENEINFKYNDKADAYPLNSTAIKNHEKNNLIELIDAVIDGLNS